MADDRREDGRINEDDPWESLIAKIWRDILGISDVGRHDSFFVLGGSSLAAMRLLATVEAATGVKIPLAPFNIWPTIASLALKVETARNALGTRAPATSSDTEQALVVLLEDAAFADRLFCVHPAGGFLWDYAHLARDLVSLGVAVHGIEARGLRGAYEPLSDIAWMASLYIREIRSIQATGPYHIAGYCVGGLIALEMARYLQAAGETVHLSLFDTTLPERDVRPGARDVAGYFSWQLLINIPAERLAKSPRAEWETIIWQQCESERPDFARQIGREQLAAFVRVFMATMEAVAQHQPTPYDGSVSCYFAETWPAESLAREIDRWAAMIPRATYESVTGHHSAILRVPHSQRLAKRIADRMRAVASVPSLMER